jgi:hypothetical protein
MGGAVHGRRQGMMTLLARGEVAEAIVAPSVAGHKE